MRTYKFEDSRASVFSKKIPSFVINKAALNELSEIHNIDRVCFKQDAYPLFVIRQLYDLYPDGVYCAYDGNDCIGYIIACANSQLIGQVLSIGVLPGYRHLGVGRDLLRTATNHFLHIGVNSVRLTVHPKNSIAKNLFKTEKFLIKLKEEHYFGQNKPRLLMEQKSGAQIISDRGISSLRGK